MYAKKTKVSVEKTRSQIETLLRKYGCEDFGYKSSNKAAQIAFTANDRMIRFELKIPPLEDFMTTPRTGQTRSVKSARAAWEQEKRSLWRALGLVIKAKIEAIQVGITTFEIEFLAHTVVPGGVIHELVLPKIDKAYKTGKLPPLLGK